MTEFFSPYMDPVWVVIAKIFPEKEQKLSSNGETVDFSAIKTLEDLLKLVDEHNRWDKLLEIEWNFSFTLLFEFINCNNEKCVKLLLDHGFKVKGELEKAVEKKNIKIVKMLLEYGAEVDDFRRDTRKPIWVAINCNAVEIFKLLKQYGANIFNGINRNGKVNFNYIYYYYLNLVVYKGYSEMVELILEESNFDTNRTKISIRLYFCSLKRAMEMFPKTSSKYRNITSRLIEHIVKVKSQNSDVSGENLLLLNDEKFIEYVNKCEEEILRLKLKINNTNISFYDILTKSDDALLGFVKGINVVSNFNSNEWEVEFPIYGKKIVRRFEKAYQHKCMLEKCIQIFASIFFNESVSTLPFECIEEIFGYFADYELRRFIDKILGPGHQHD